MHQVFRTIGRIGFSLFVVAASMAAVQAQTWRPLKSGAESRSETIAQSAVFPIPISISTGGGVIKALLVGGGQGGSASWSSCDDQAVQGGSGGDGGEVLEVEIPLAPGQCQAGLVVSIGKGGRGAFRGSSSAAGEQGGATTIECAGQVVARAAGGGVRAEVLSAIKGVRGGLPGLVSNAAESSKNSSFDQRVITVKGAGSGETGYLGYAASGGGGGVMYSTEGTAVKRDGSTATGAKYHYAPMGRGGYGAGSGAGSTGYGPVAPVVGAENAVMYGAGGGGGAAICIPGSSIGRDAGNGRSGVVKFTWQD